MSKRQMVLVGFLQAQNCSNYPASWRHPESATDFLTADYYQRIARILEAGKFHLAFFDDRLALPDIYGGDHAEAVRNGVRVVKMDPIPILTMMGAVTTRLGLGATCSTTYYQPFHVARMFSTLDHMSGGRAAWNVVTSLNDSEAANYGADRVIDHNERYDRADEFMEVVLGHWEAWDPDAIVLDKERSVFADPAGVHRLDHEGRFLRSRGPFTVPRTPQGRPIVIQAGQSGRGRQFAARWADVIFAIYPNLEFGRKAYAATRDAATAAGREPGSYRVAPAAYVTVAEAQAEAEEKAAFIARPRAAHRHAGAALRGAQLRFRDETCGRALHRRGDGLHQRPAGDPRPRRDAQRQSASDGRGFRDLQPPRHGQRDASFRRHAGGCCR